MKKVEIREIGDKEFKSEVIDSQIPVLVDFCAKWCGPCQAMNPVLEEIASLYSEKIKVIKVDIDKANDIPKEFGIRSVPTFLIFKEGKVQEQVVGIISKQKLKNILQKIM
jgi:thioredoxin 1